LVELFEGEPDDPARSRNIVFSLQRNGDCRGGLLPGALLPDERRCRVQTMHVMGVQLVDERLTRDVDHSEATLPTLRHRIDVQGVVSLPGLGHSLLLGIGGLGPGYRTGASST